MTEWLLKNALPMGLSALLTALIAFGLHTLAVSWIEASYERKLTEQKTVLTEQCAASKAITKEVSDDYQKKLTARDASLSDARRLLNRKCAAPVVVSTPTGHNGSPVQGQPSGQDDRALRADANDLIDIAAEGEKYRLQLIGCQTFIEKSVSIIP